MRELYHIPAPTRERIYDFIRVYQSVHQMPPTLREVADGVGLRSLSGVQWHLARLIEEGRMYERDGRFSRNMRLREQSDTASDPNASSAPARRSLPHAPLIH